MCIYFASMQSENDIYEGPRDENGLPHGEGKLILVVGGTVTGTWVHGKQEGQGHVKFDSGAEYIGEILDDKYHGWGKFTDPGQSYEGDWVNDLPHGVGIMHNDDGSIYVGELAEGEYHGEGKLHHPNGSKDEGVWHEGKLVTVVGKRRSTYALNELAL